MRDIENKRTPLSCFFFYIFYNTLLSLSFSLSHFNNFSRTRKERKRAADPLLVSLPRKIPEGEKGAQTAGRDTSSLSRALFPTLSTLFVFSLSLALSVTRISWPRPLSTPPPLCAQRERQHKGKGEERRHTGGGRIVVVVAVSLLLAEEKKGVFFCFFRLVFVGRIPRGGRKRRSKVQKGFS